MGAHEPPTKEMIEEWKRTWQYYKERLQPNRKSGRELLEYLHSRYVLTETEDKRAAAVVCDTVIMNKPFAAKLPSGKYPVPKTFFLENTGPGKCLYAAEKRETDLRIFVGVDLTTGFFLVEGSTMLWEELCAFQGLDERDLQNYVCVANYVNSLKRVGRLDGAL